MSKKIVWALYDDGEMSYNNALKDNDKYEVISFGINNKYKVNVINITNTNPNLINEFKKFPKPDIIICSPPCESWSNADTTGRIYHSLKNEDNLLKIEIKSKSWYDNYNEITSINRRRSHFQKESDRVIGEATGLACAMIIDYFKPKAWVVENPEQSGLFKYLEYCGLVGTKNSTYYNNYDAGFSLKPTIFYSNIPMELRKNRLNNGVKMSSSYNRRSAIPKELIKDIFERIDNG